MGDATVIGIYLAAREGEPVIAVDFATATPGRGLEGDRYHQINGAATRYDATKEITLVEAEAIERAAQEFGLDLPPGGTRRNLVTQGVELNPLVGATFKAGDATLRGLELCHPCGHLQKLTGKPVVKAFVGRGGLRAQIVESGRIEVGSRIEVLNATETPQGANIREG